MSAVSITAANVLKSASAVGPFTKNAGATITAGQVVYLDSGTDTLKLADANLSVAAATVAGIALHGAYSGNPCQYVAVDPAFVVGGTLVAGQLYCLGATAGTIVPVTDLTTGDVRAVLGVANSTSTLNLNCFSGTVVGP